MGFMNVQELTRAYSDKRLPVEFIDGVSEGILVIMVSNSHCHEECDGVVYEGISSNRHGWTKTGDTFWTEMKYIKSFTPLGDLN